MYATTATCTPGGTLSISGRNALSGASTAPGRAFPFSSPTMSDRVRLGTVGQIGQYRDGLAPVLLCPALGVPFVKEIAQFAGADGMPWDVTGWDVHLDFRARPTDSAVQLSCTEANGRLVFDRERAAVTLHLSADDVTALGSESEADLQVTGYWPMPWWAVRYRCVVQTWATR